jgi:hypothetical protein
VLTISVRDGDRYYRATVTPEWAERHDNFTLVSIGLTVGEDLTARAWADLRRRYPARVTEVSRDAWNHSACQSSCTRRGAAVCRW